MKDCIQTVNVFGFPLGICYGSEYHIELSDGAPPQCGRSTFTRERCGHHVELSDHLVAFVHEVRSSELEKP